MKKSIRTLILIAMLFTLFSSSVDAANFILIPAASAVYIGSGISVYLQVNSSDQPSNSYTAVISFDGNYLTPLSVSKSGSICTLFVAEPSIGASSARVTCGLPSPGYGGASGNLITMNFRAKKVGTTHLGISGGAILANDGYGTNILRSSNGTSIRVLAAPEEPEAPPEVDISTPNVTADQGEAGEWLKTDQIKFSWDMPESAEGFSYILTQDKNANPEKKNATSELSKTFTNLKDGTHYFKIYATDGDNYSDLVTYMFKIDNTGPEEFDVVIEPEQDGLYEAMPLIGFAAVDSGSGVDRYEMRIDDGEFFDAINPHIFTELSGGTHLVVLRAYDTVGNFTEKELSFGVIEFAAPVIISPSNNEIVQITENGFVISGTGEPRSSVLLYIDGELIGVAQTNMEGRFTFSTTETLLPGQHTITAQIKNDGGILGLESQPVIFTLEESLVTVSSLDLIQENLAYIGLCGGSLLFGILILLLILILKRRKKDEDEVVVDEQKAASTTETTLTPKPEPVVSAVSKGDIDKEREIERRLSSAKLEIDHELHDLERELRQKVEENPTGATIQDQKLEHDISEAIEDSEDKIDAILNPERIIDNKDIPEEMPAQKTESVPSTPAAPTPTPAVRPVTSPINPIQEGIATEAASQQANRVDGSVTSENTPPPEHLSELLTPNVEIESPEVDEGIDITTPTYDLGGSTETSKPSLEDSSSPPKGSSPPISL